MLLCGLWLFNPVCVGQQPPDGIFRKAPKSEGGLTLTRVCAANAQCPGCFQWIFKESTQKYECYYFQKHTCR